MIIIQKAWEAFVVGTGLVRLIPAGLPAHLRPSAARLDVGSASQGEQRSSGVPHAFTFDTLHKTVHIKFADPVMNLQSITMDNDVITLDQTVATPGSVTWQGNNINPALESAWVVLDTITADGVKTNDDVFQFIRVNVSDAGDTGTVLVSLSASS
jgi:hypothetical protein